MVGAEVFNKTEEDESIRAGFDFVIDERTFTPSSRESLDGRLSWVLNTVLFFFFGRCSRLGLTEQMTDKENCVCVRFCETRCALARTVLDLKRKGTEEENLGCTLKSGKTGRRPVKGGDSWFAFTFLKVTSDISVGAWAGLLSGTGDSTL